MSSATGLKVQLKKFAGAKKAEMKKTATEKWKRIQAIIVARSALLQANVNTLMKDYERFLNKIYPETTNETTAIAARNRHKLRYGKSLITSDRDDQEGTNSDNEEDIQDNDQIDEQSGEVGTVQRDNTQPKVLQPKSKKRYVCKGLMCKLKRRRMMEGSIKVVQPPKKTCFRCTQSNQERILAQRFEHQMITVVDFRKQVIDAIYRSLKSNSKPWQQ